MVKVAGKVCTRGALQRKSGLVALLAVLSACGGRSAMIDDTGFEDGDGGAGEGGTTGSGGVSGQGGSGVAGTYAVGGYGAYPNGGYSGSVYPGGYGGFAGSVYPGGYGGFAGSVYPGGKGGFAGSVYPGGYGGFAGSVYPGGYGGFAGSVYPGGKGGVGGSVYPAGAAGSAGFGGKSAYGELSASCSLFCSNLPPICAEGLTFDDCQAQCIESGLSEPQCAGPFTDYANCVGKNMLPYAMCRVDGSGVCGGPYCLDEALAACAGESLRYLDCLDSGPQCPKSIESSSRACRQISYCDRTYDTECFYSFVEQYWTCHCYADSAYSGSTVVASPGRNACSVGAEYCGFPQ